MHDANLFHLADGGGTQKLSDKQKSPAALAETFQRNCGESESIIE